MCSALCALEYLTADSQLIPHLQLMRGSLWLQGVPAAVQRGSVVSAMTLGTHQLGQHCHLSETATGSLRHKPLRHTGLQHHARSHCKLPKLRAYLSDCPGHC